MNFKICSVSYNKTYKIIGKHPDGRLFAVRVDGTDGLHVVDRDLNLLTTLSTTFDDKANKCIFLKSGTMIAWSVYNGFTNRIFRSNDLTYNSFTAVLTMSEEVMFIEKCLDYSELDDTIMLNEYTTARPIVYGTDRVPAVQKIWRGTNDGRDWEVAVSVNRNPQFEGDTNVIRHFHSVQYDPFENKFWVTSGDGLTNNVTGEAVDNRYGFENKIMTIEANGNQLTTIAEGSQKTRTTGLVFTENYVIFGSDSNWVSSSYFRRYNRATGEIEDIQKNNDCVRIIDKISTSWGEIFIANKSNEAGSENPERNTQLYLSHVSKDGRDWDLVYSWKSIGTSLFYSLIDGGENRIYGYVIGILDENGDNFSGSVIMDIYPDVASLSVRVSDEVKRFPLQNSDDTIGSSLKVSINGDNKYIPTVEEAVEHDTSVRVYTSEGVRIFSSENLTVQ